MPSLATLPLGPARRAVEESFTLRRIARRIGVWQPIEPRTEPPTIPVGVKLELTYACNLRCGFCYTDSPRRTLERATDLSEEDWLRIVDEAIELGVIEAVITGGEPFLRRDLVFAVLERFNAAGVGPSLNTNGWFVDEEVARRLAEIRGLHVHVSIDGATPELHDKSRGVPGSWRRAVQAVHNLISVGVSAHTVHVLTPDNQDGLPEFLDLMWSLGAPTVRVTPVVEVGAAARGGEWKVDRQQVRKVIDAFHRARGEEMRILLQGGNAASLAVPDEAAPASLLVRPNGAVLTDSLRPFAYGHAIRDGLDACWRGIVEHWNDPQVSEWAGSISGSRDLANSNLVPYLDDEPMIGDDPNGSGSARERHLDDPIPAATPPRNGAGGDPTHLAQSREHVLALALSRRYRLADVRAGGSAGERYVRRLADGKVWRLNGSAAAAMEALDDGTVADAVRGLAGLAPGIPEAQLQRDALGAARTLMRRGLIFPAGARGPVSFGEPATPDLPDADPGAVA